MCVFFLEMHRLFSSLWFGCIAWVARALPKSAPTHRESPSGAQEKGTRCALCARVGPKRRGRARCFFGCRGDAGSRKKGGMPESSWRVFCEGSRQQKKYDRRCPRSDAHEKAGKIKKLTSAERKKGRAKRRCVAKQKERPPGARRGPTASAKMRQVDPAARSRITVRRAPI